MFSNIYDFQLWHTHKDRSTRKVFGMFPELVAVPAILPFFWKWYVILYLVGGLVAIFQFFPYVVGVLIIPID